MAGCISENSAGAAIAAIDQSVKSFVIRSPGGDAEAGMRLGERMRLKSIPVTVRDYCVSSCANYVFMAATRRRAEPGGALLAFHGTAFTTLTSLLSDQEFFYDTALLARLRRIVETERLFYMRVKVDPDAYRLTGIPSLGRHQRAQWRTHSHSSPRSCAGLSRPFWLPSSATLSKMGLEVEGALNDRGDQPRLAGYARAAGISDGELSAALLPIDRWPCSRNLLRRFPGPA